MFRVGRGFPLPVVSQLHATAAFRSARLSAFTVLAVLLMQATPCFAELSKEAALERCRETVGRPIVKACMMALGGRGVPNAEANFEGCRAKASPQVKACVIAALNAANGRANVAVEAPKEVVPVAPVANAAPAGFVAPPRTISDITAILDSEKPDLKKIEQLKAAADAAPTGKESREELARFYFDRGNARSQLGRLADAIADADKSVEVGRGAVSPNLLGRLMQLQANQYATAGNPKKAFDIYQAMLREVAKLPGGKGYQFGANRAIAGILLQMGDVAQAETYVQRSQPLIQEARTSGLPGWRKSYGIYGQNWEAEIELGRAILFEARGQFDDAELSYKLGEQRKRAGIKGLLASENPPSESLMMWAVDSTLLSQARMISRQGRFAEAEADARRALLSRLKDQGKYNPATPRFIMGLAGILVEQGRYAEAEQLSHVSLDINGTVGVPDDSQSTVQILSQLGGILNLERKDKEAGGVYARIDKATAGWEPGRRQMFELSGSRIVSLYASGQIDAGIAAAQELVKRLTARTR